MWVSLGGGKGRGVIRKGRWGEGVGEGRNEKGEVGRGGGKRGWRGRNGEEG